MKTKERINYKKLIKLLFIAVTAVALISGILRAVVAPKAVNYYENRPADTIDRPSFASYLSGEFQNSVEAALADQIPMAQSAKKLYNDSLSSLQLFFLKPMIGHVMNTYINYKSISFYNDSLINPPLHIDDYAQIMADTVSSYNRAIAACPEADFYLYLVEYEGLLNFSTGEKEPLYEYLQSELDIPTEHVGRFELKDYQQFRECFYRTDHHWNAAGSYRGYKEVMALLGNSEPLLEPVGEESFLYANGSKAKDCGLTMYTENATAYRFDYPELGAQYGKEDAFFAGERDDFSYMNFYGGDPGELVFDTNRPDRENILVFGDSYDNAILKLIASHYGRTYSVDMRNYANQTGQSFDLPEYVKENEISKVIFLGSFLLYTGDFVLEG